jgi:hypothetical protein
MEKCNSNIDELISLAESLLSLSDRGDIDRNDDSCGVLYGVARDSSYKILELAKAEKSKHIELGKWK